MYDGIIIGGINFDRLGRPIGPYRLRTSAQKNNYSIKVIDYASSLSKNELLLILDKLITEKTKILGISASWFHKTSNSNLWLVDDFFKIIKEKHKNIKVVVGGTKINTDIILYKNTDWFLTGFSDVSFVKLLDHFNNIKTDLKYIKNKDNIYIVNSDQHHALVDMDQIDTIFNINDEFYSYQPLPIEISRGCIFQCAFCTHPFLGKKNYDYIRKPENIAIELKRNYENFGTYRYFILDDTFNDSIEKLDRVKKAIDISKIPRFEFVSYIKPELLVTKPQMIDILIDLGLKGAHFGIESLNDSSRKIIGKGIRVSKVLDIANKLTSKKIKINASFILGLPEDTIEDFYRWQEFLEKNIFQLFTSWRYHPLGLMKSIYNYNYSLIEKNPTKYGYTTKEKENSIWLQWSNKNTNSVFCNSLTKFFNQKNEKICKVAGWELGAAWFHNISQENIDTKTIKNLNLNSQSMNNSRNRALHNLKNIK